MVSHGTVVFRGASGEAYRFSVWPMGTKFRAAGGVCLFSKRTYPNPTFPRRVSHECVCVGHTSDLSQLAYHLPQLASADCICIYLTDDVQQRLRMQADLIQAFGIWHDNFLVDLSPCREAGARTTS